MAGHVRPTYKRLAAPCLGLSGSGVPRVRSELACAGYTAGELVQAGVALAECPSPRLAGLRDGVVGDGCLETDCPGIIGAGQEQDVVGFAVSSASLVQEVFDEAGQLGFAAGAKRAGFVAGKQDGGVVLADARDERLDGAFGVEAEVLQASAERPVRTVSFGSGPRTRPATLPAPAFNPDEKSGLAQPKEGSSIYGAEADGELHSSQIRERGTQWGRISACSEFASLTTVK